MCPSACRKRTWGQPALNNSLKTEFSAGGDETVGRARRATDDKYVGRVASVASVAASVAGGDATWAVSYVDMLVACYLEISIVDASRDTYKPYRPMENSVTEKLYWGPLHLRCNLYYIRLLRLF